MDNEIALPLISIVVPVYKTEAYINKCVDSLLSQTYKNIEIILVDDESPDRCGEICDAYMLSDSRVRSIHIKNSGCGGARNAGARIAKGEYIAFLDSDDYFDSDMIEYLYTNLINTASDISYCSFRNVYENGKIIPKKEAGADSDVKVYTGREAAISALTITNGFSMYVWNAIFPVNLIEEFTEKRMAQDQNFTVKVLLKAKRVCMGAGPKCNYLIRANSSRSADLRKRMNDIDFILSDMGIAVSENDPTILPFYYKRCLMSYIRLSDHYCTRKLDDKDLFSDIQQKILKYSDLFYGKNIKGCFMHHLFCAGVSYYRLIFRFLEFFRHE